MHKPGTGCLIGFPVQCVAAYFLEYKNMSNPNPDPDVGYWGGNVAILALCAIFALVLGLTALWQYKHYLNQVEYDVSRARTALCVYAGELLLVILGLTLLWHYQ